LARRSTARRRKDPFKKVSIVFASPQDIVADDGLLFELLSAEVAADYLADFLARLCD
jgi:hypothetical protein